MIGVSAGTNITDVHPFMQDGDGYRFTDYYLSAKTGLVTDKWMQVFVQAPVDAAATQGIGVGVNCSADCTGDLYIDAVNLL